VKWFAVGFSQNGHNPIMYMTQEGEVSSNT
jgi:hypothetical protein